MKILSWKKPDIVCIQTRDLVCKIKAKASSIPSCHTAYGEENGCPEISVENTWGPGGEVDPQCGVLTACIEVGPLFGCERSVYCSSLMHVL